jgi:Chalcone isomerase-like
MRSFRFTTVACRRGLVAVALVALGTIAVPAIASEARPPEVVAAHTAMKLQGRGSMRFLGLSIYDARLWAGSGFTAGQYTAHPFALELQYARALDATAIAERSIVEMRRAGRVEDAQTRAWTDALLRAIPDVVPGDRVTGLHVPGEPTRFFHNGRFTAAVADPAFADRFFGIWLAATTSEPGLRRQLIGSTP